MHPYSGILKRWQKVALLLCGMDYLCIVASYLLALYFRFDFVYANIPRAYFQTFRETAPYYAFGAILVYMVLRLYRCAWRYVGYNDMARCILAGGLSCLGHWILMQLYADTMPLSYFVFGGILQMAALVGSRFFFRFLCLVKARYLHNSELPRERAMLVGAGSAGHLILRDLSTTNQHNLLFTCVIDDDPNKWGSYLEGIRVVGGRELIPEMAEKYDVQKIFIAIPKATKEQRADILNICKETNCEVKLLPGFYQFADDEVHITDMQNVTVADLLRDSSVSVDEKSIKDYFRGRTVLVTGGGGSIGSELCRQIAACSPKSLIVFDHYENLVSALRIELCAKYPQLDFVVQIGSVQDVRRIVQVCRQFHPQAVIHAAGYKHVGLMENSPSEAVKNNILGTYWTARAAIEAGTELFVYLSTDKAVNSTSVLGVTSRINEMLLEVLAQKGSIQELERLLEKDMPFDAPQGPGHLSTHFVSIRFGNALGSAGSVFEVFQKQIEDGGPVMVRHKDIKRFCMSVSDVVKLLMQACAFGEKNVTYVLDLGKPYNIDELARSLIKLKGFIPDKEIKIEYTGLQPGEKLCDEPLMWEEGMSRTSHPQIVIANSIKFRQDYFEANLCNLLKAALENQAGLKELLAKVVHSYHDSDSSSPDYIKSMEETPQPPIDLLEQVARQFDIAGDVRAIVPMTSGYINRTYKVESVGKDGRLHAYTLQRINTEIFKSPEKLMRNYVAVTRHLSAHLHVSNRKGELSNPMPIPTRDGAYFHANSFGAWRMLTFLHDVHSYDVVESPEVFHQAGRTFGAFLKAVSTLDASSLHEVILDFHNTPKRYSDLEAAIEKDPLGRAAECKSEIDFVRGHADLFGRIADALEKGDIPLRVGHNDCNLNNILFDNATNLPVAIIDLDTVMPSTPLYDFGDSMRSGTNTARDDEKDLTKVSCNLELYESYALGWLEACGDMLTKRELELLPYASLVITSEDGIRFLADYLTGDTYYHTDYLGQNLDRARTQLRLLEDMEQKLPEIKRIISDICSKLKICA